MRLVLLVALTVLVWCAPVSLTTELAGTTVSTGTTTSRYGFYRKMPGSILDGTRRIFGAESGNLTEFAAACALLDQYWAGRCSAAVVSPRWAVTAAHCLSGTIAYVQYNAHSSTSRDGNIARVLYLYRHPEYQVEERDDGEGIGVFLLHHDVGLVHVNEDMVLLAKLRADPLVAMKNFRPADMNQQELTIMGFGRTETLRTGEELFTVKLRMVPCNRDKWFHCMCGISSSEHSGDSGVCSADSGGPVLYRGVQVAVTSMGPLECATVIMRPPVNATSVFTSLYRYADLINATLRGSKNALRMTQISHAVMCHLSDTAFVLEFLLLVCNRNNKSLY